MNYSTRYKNKISNLFLIFLLCFPFLLNAQSRTIRGKVVDAYSGQALIGSSIQIVGTKTGVITDENGEFQIENQNVPLDLEVNFIGYDKKTLTITSYNPYKISLSEVSNQFDELLVVGYGRQKKKVSTGSVAKIESKQLEGIALPDVASTMEGQMAGIIINESSGQPGASKTLLIRGVSTNGDNTPLFIVDGVQVGNIDNINPSDVESIDVLKDAASSAIYGARAANGVVIITTKGGNGSDIGTFTYSMS